jgi:hypothetical protein
MIFVYLLGIYLIFVWVILRLAVPYLGFFKTPVPEDIPLVLQKRINDWNRDAIDDRQFLTFVYEYITQTYTGSRIKTITHFWTAFQDPLQARTGFLPCTAQNFLLRTILIKSNRFTESDIQVKVIPLNFFIHQYLRVRIGSEVIDVDPWSHFLGVKLGEKSAILG